MLLDCSANLKVDEVEEDADEVSSSCSSLKASYQEKMASPQLPFFRMILMGKWLHCAGIVLEQAGFLLSHQSRRIELPGLYLLC